MHTPPFSEYVDRIAAGDWQGVAELMLSSADKLAQIGADFLICPDNTIHRALPYVETQSPLPWLHIADVVAAAAVNRGFRRVGITGTRWLVDSEVYPQRLEAHGITCVHPGSEDALEMHHIIMDQLVYGVFKPQATALFQELFRRFKAEGCDAVVLGCTEIPLIMSDENSPIRVLDSTRLLARAALRHAFRKTARTSG
jgi:aspartate racemase